MVTEKQFKEIIDLFKICYPQSGRTISLSMLKWMYNDKEYPTIVSLEYMDKKLVGHYALRILPKKLDDGTLGKAAISFNTMVHPDYQHRGIFISLAKKAYDEARKSGVDCIYGFPNKNSSHGFFKYLGWTQDNSLFEYRISTKKGRWLNCINEGTFQNIHVGSTERLPIKHRCNNYIAYNRGNYEVLGVGVGNGRFSNWCLYKNFYNAEGVIRHLLTYDARNKKMLGLLMEAFLYKSEQDGLPYIYLWDNNISRIPSRFKYEVVRPITYGYLSFTGRKLYQVEALDSDSY